jgi:F0F1-type ATP synthase assembly protein I
VTVINVVSLEPSGNSEVGVGVGVGVGMGEIVDVGSVVGTTEPTGCIVVTVVTGLLEGEDCVMHPVTRMKKMREITKSRGTFIVLAESFSTD